MIAEPCDHAQARTILQRRPPRGVQVAAPRPEPDPFVSRPATLEAICTHARGATLHVLRTHRAVEAFLATFNA
jgi:hypothetical protein